MLSIKHWIKLCGTLVLAGALVSGAGMSVLPAQRALAIPSPTPNLSINDVSLNEGQAGTTTFTFTVSLTAPAGVSGVTFDIATQNNTAVAPGDYTAKSLTGQTIPSGSSTYSFSVSVNGDTIIEPNETFFVNVTNVIGANVTDGQGQGTLVNDDVIAACAATRDDGLTVFSTANAGAVQSAIDAASAGDTVKIAGTCAGTNSRGGSNQTAYITTPLTLRGGYTVTDWSTINPAAYPTILDALNGGRVITVSAPLAINDVIIQHGNVTGVGGGINTSARLTLTNVSLLTNTASSNGGGVYASGAAMLNGGLFQNNSSTSAQGGGLYALSTLDLTGTQFLSNTATVGGGARVGGAATLNGGLFQDNQANTANGGGLNVVGTLDLTGTQFTSNTAANGGGVYAAGALTLTNAAFISNTAHNCCGGLQARGVALLINTTFMSNTAQASYGGGASFDGATTAVSSSLFQGNTAATGGGGVIAFNPLVLTGTQFLSNTAITSGGGVQAGGAATLKLNGATFQNNKCTTGGCLSAGWYANSALTLNQIVTTSDDIQNQGLTTQSIDGVIVFNGSARQSINGAGSTTFSHMEVNNTGSGVTLGQNITVTDRLTLTTDLTTTASYRLNLASAATTSGTGDVWGKTYRNHAFSFDTPYAFGNPNVSLTFGSTSTVPSAALIELQHGAPAGFATAFNRAYTITVTGGSPFSATLRLHYQDSEVSGSEASGQLLRYDGSAWVAQGKTASDTTENWLEQSGVTAFSPWAVSSQTPTAITLRTFEAAQADRAVPVSIGLAALLVVSIGSALVIRRRRIKAL